MHGSGSMYRWQNRYYSCGVNADLILGVSLGRLRKGTEGLMQSMGLPWMQC